MKERFEKFKAQYQEESKKLQAELRANPSSEASKKAGRTAGVFFFIMGITLIGINYYTWMIQGRVWTLLIASMITFLALGPWLMIAGKMPSRKR